MQIFAWKGSKNNELWIVGNSGVAWVKRRLEGSGLDVKCGDWLCATQPKQDFCMRCLQFVVNAKKNNLSWRDMKRSSVFSTWPPGHAWCL